MLVRDNSESVYLASDLDFAICTETGRMLHKPQHYYTTNGLRDNELHPVCDLVSY